MNNAVASVHSGDERASTNTEAELILMVVRLFPHLQHGAA
jgi:hypothetical protein